MKNFLKNNWFKIALLLIIILGFYWYSWHPMQERKECANLAIEIIERQNRSKATIGYVPISESADENDEAFYKYFKRCLIEQGFKE